MNFEHSTVIEASKERVWNFLMDVPHVSQCVPGVQEVKALDANTYAGTLKMRVGPIAVSLAGKIVMEEQDEAAGRATMSAQGSDSKMGGGVSAKLEMLVSELAADQAKLTISTSANVLGKLGEFGQPVIRKKAEQMMGEFTENVKKAVTQ